MSHITGRFTPKVRDMYYFSRLASLMYLVAPRVVQSIGHFYVTKVTNSSPVPRKISIKITFCQRIVIVGHIFQVRSLSEF